MSYRQVVARLCLCIGIGLLGLLGGAIPLLTNAEESLGLRLLYLVRGPEKPTIDVTVVGIDGESAKQLNLPLVPKKWPRQLHSQLVERLSEQKAAVIAFDVIFHEFQEPANDQGFAEAIDTAGNVVLTQGIKRQTVPIHDQGEGRTVQLNIERLISAIPIFSDAAVGQGPFPLPKVPVQLNQFWCFRPGAGNIPTLPVVALHVYAKEAFDDFIHLLFSVDETLKKKILSPKGEIFDTKTIIQMIQPLYTLFMANSSLASQALEKLENNPSEKMTDETKKQVRSLLHLYNNGNSRYLNLYGPSGTISTISYHRILEKTESDRFDSELDISEGAAFFIGQTGSHWIQNHDDFRTAFSGEMGEEISGVEIAATAFANLLENKSVYPMQPLPRVIFLMAWGVLTVVISLHFSTVFSAVGLLVFNGVYLALAQFQFSSAGHWYPLVVPVFVQTPSAFIVSMIFKYRKARNERENIREAFGHYLPDEVVDRLSANTKNLHLGGKVFYGICLFTDAQNYTTLSERMDPCNLTQLMNRYYRAIFEPIEANGGLVLQVVGDSVFALWSSPEKSYQHKRDACRASLGIAAAVDRFNRQEGQYAMPIRIGIHAGEILLGNIGAMKHFEYRPVGDIVNTASRLEGLNKFLGTQILVSQEALGMDDSALTRSVGWFILKGKTQPVHVYELFAAHRRPENVQEAVCRHFTYGLTAFHRTKWDEAEKQFRQVLKIDETDGPANFYLNQCQKVRHMPLDENWNGAVVLKSK